MVDELIIKRAENGYILEKVFLYEEPDDYHSELIVISDDGITENKSLKKLLLSVAEWAGYHYDKYSDNNIEISFDGKGHKL